MEECFDEPKKEFKYLASLKSNDFVENACKIKYRIEIFEDHVLLHELDSKGNEIKDAKKRKMTSEIMDGLLRNRHFSKTDSPRRISHGEVETRLEFNKLVPK